MSLKYELKDIDQWKEKCFREDNSLITETEIIIFATTIIGMNEITKKTADEFFLRLIMANAALGFFTTQDDSLSAIRAIVHSHIGLKTNSKMATMSQYKKYLVGLLYERARNALDELKKSDATNNNGDEKGDSAT